MIEAPHYSAAGASKKAVPLPETLFDADYPGHYMRQMNFDVWKTDLLGFVKTDVGKSILGRLEGMFTGQDSNNT